MKTKINSDVTTGATYESTPVESGASKKKFRSFLSKLVPLRILSKSDVDQIGNYPVVTSVLIFGITVFEYRQIEPW